MTLRELKYVITGEDRLSAKMRGITNSTEKANRSLAGHSDRLGSLKKQFSQASSAVPALGNAVGGLGTAFAAIANPITLAAVAIAGVGLALRKGIQEASLFELEFRKLQNINLDKSSGQINDLRSNVLNMGLTGGYDPRVMSQGIFDIQSLTGNSGYGSQHIVTQQAEFARASGADINKYIAGTGIAMKNFGFGPEALDQYNKSAMGLVSTAKITYDQLAEVSSMYAGPAAAANQTFSSANKLMAIFTTKTKSAEEAATLTKTAFTDLFKKETADSFKSVGINLYDINGNAKQVDQIMLELNKKFAKRTTAESMDELRNKFKGSEGINALLSAAKDQSGALLNTLNTFDKAGGGLQKMLDSAKSDINIINDKVNGEMKTAWSKLGEAVLPAWVNIKSIFVDIVGMAANIGTAEGGALGWAKDKKNAVDLESWYKSELGQVDYAKQGKMSAAEYSTSQGYYRKRFMEAWTLNKSGKGTEKDLLNARNVMSQSKEMQGLLHDAFVGSFTKNPVNDKGGVSDPSITKGLNNVSGGGVRNVTVTINKLVESFNVNTTNVKQGAGEIKEDIEATLVRAVNGAEQILGN